MALNRDEKATIIKEFAQNAQDTGSSEVQVALLTRDIKDLTEHCRQNPKDYSTRRGLLKKVCQRRDLLSYLKRKDPVKYKEVIERLELRK